MPKNFTHKYPVISKLYLYNRPISVSIYVTETIFCHCIHIEDVFRHEILVRKKLGSHFMLEDMLLDFYEDNMSVSILGRS